MEIGSKEMDYERPVNKADLLESDRDAEPTKYLINQGLPPEDASQKSGESIKKKS